MKQTQPDPWTELMEKYPAGMIVDGKVTNVVSFGAFVEFAENVEGLVHISELATQHIDSPKQVVHVGDEVKVKIVEYDLEKRRISLSCKAAAEELGFTIDVEEPEGGAQITGEGTEPSSDDAVKAEEQPKADVEPAKGDTDAEPQVEAASEEKADAPNEEATEEAKEDANEAEPAETEEEAVSE